MDEKTRYINGELCRYRPADIAGAQGSWVGQDTGKHYKEAIIAGHESPRFDVVYTPDKSSSGYAGGLGSGYTRRSALDG